MKQYLELLEKVMSEGAVQSNRTGIPARGIQGAMLQFNLQEGFPAVTTKRLAFFSVVGELLGFLRAYSNASDFRKLGCDIWDKHANENKEWFENPYRIGRDDLGLIYGIQWRDWFNPYSKKHIDQLQQVIDNLERPSSNDRRLIVTAWNPSELDRMALPPCHVLYQFLPNRIDNTLSLSMYQRSCDVFLGLPFNIASYALLLELICKLTGFIPHKLIMFLADAHLYENHIEQTKLQLKREPKKLPKLSINLPTPVEGAKSCKIFDTILPKDIYLENYDSHPAILAEMAV